MSQRGRGGKSPADCRGSPRFSPLRQTSGWEVCPQPPRHGGSQSPGSTVGARRRTWFPLGLGVSTSPHLHRQNRSFCAAGGEPLRCGTLSSIPASPHMLRAASFPWDGPNHPG